MDGLDGDTFRRHTRNGVPSAVPGGPPGTFAIFTLSAAVAQQDPNRGNKVSAAWATPGNRRMGIERGFTSANANVSTAKR